MMSQKRCVLTYRLSPLFGGNFSSYSRHYRLLSSSSLSSSFSSFFVGIVVFVVVIRLKCRRSGAGFSLNDIFSELRVCDMILMDIGLLMVMLCLASITTIS